MFIYYYFNLWKEKIISFKAYDLWCQSHNDDKQDDSCLNLSEFYYLSECESDV